MSIDPVEILLNSVSSGHPTEFVVTGLMMRYYHTCHRELWFESHDIEIDRSTNSIQRGTRVDDMSYSNLSEVLHIGPIAPDVMEDGKILEVKPSSSMEKASKMQLGYYLWYLKHKCGENRKGVLTVPNEKERTTVKLTAELESEIEDAIREIYEVVSKESPPEPEEKPFCETCAYQDFCWGGYDG